MGTNGRRGPARLILGSVAEQVVRLSPVPVVTVRENARAGEVLRRSASWSASTCRPARSRRCARPPPSPAASVRAAISCTSSSSRRGGTSTVSAAWPISPASAGSSRAHARGTAALAVEELEGVACDTHLRIGRPAQAIAALAEELGAELSSSAPGRGAACGGFSSEAPPGPLCARPPVRCSRSSRPLRRCRPTHRRPSPAARSETGRAAARRRGRCRVGDRSPLPLRPAAPGTSR